MFKKIIITLLLVGFLAPCAIAGEESELLAQMWNERIQREAIFTARASLEDATNNLYEYNAKVQRMIEELGGNFDTIPTSTKKILNRWRNMFNQLQAAIEADPEIIELYNWRPSE